MIIAGVDPGKTGTAAFLDTATGLVVSSRLQFDDGVLLWEKVHNAAPGPVDAVYVEKVQGRGGWSAQSNFAFGGTYWQIRLGCRLSKWYAILIEPRKWQKIIHVDIQKGLSPKERSRLAYARYFPDDPLPRSKRNNDLNHNDIDALLIAAYGTLITEGKIVRPGGLVSWSLDQE